MRGIPGYSQTLFLIVVSFLASNVTAQTHAPWPADWNDWSDVDLMVTVGNPGNADELSGGGAGGWGQDVQVGSVAYTFKIGTFEVTAGQYCQFLNAVAVTDSYGLYDVEMDTNIHYLGCNIKRNGSSGSYTYSVAADWANRPVNCVSWGDAARYCNWLTNGQPVGDQLASTTENGSYAMDGATTDEALVRVTRSANAHYVIPSESEWYKAAYYDPAIGSYYDYPTRSCDSPSDILGDPTDPGNNATFNNNTAGAYYRSLVGDHENSCSAYGTLDQGGNVYEWTEAVYGGTARIMRGGSFASPGSALRAADRNPDPASYNLPNTGFRIVEVPEPATLSLLAVGGLAALRRRRVA